MGSRIICIFMILLLSYLPITESASAQWIPDVDIECEAVNPSGNLEINITNGSNRTDYANCTVSNPNMYQEKISISINSGSLAVAAPGEIYIDANSEVDFVVTVRAETSTMNQTIQLNIVAEVVEANGLPPPNSASAESNLLVDIILYEEANETENVVSSKSDGQSLVYSGIGGVILLVLVLFVISKRRK